MPNGCWSAAPAERPPAFFLAGRILPPPHTPYVAPEKYFQGYPEAEMPVVAGVAEDQEDILRPVSAAPEEEQERDDRRPAARKAVPISPASHLTDAQVGRVS
ncbi:MAG: hypothetical protein R3F11_12285 [Verrucomicrobiales bacterium]